MRIRQRITRVRQEILDGNTTLGNDIAQDAISAMFKGIGSPEWETFMRRFSTNTAELNRLCGREASFNNSRWGLACLAYIAGNGVCTALTATETGTERGMTPPMLVNLDAENQAAAIFENEDTMNAFVDAQPI